MVHVYVHISCMFWFRKAHVSALVRTHITPSRLLLLMQHIDGNDLLVITDWLLNIGLMTLSKGGKGNTHVHITVCFHGFLTFLIGMWGCIQV